MSRIMENVIKTVRSLYSVGHVDKAVLQSFEKQYRGQSLEKADQSRTGRQPVKAAKE